MAESVYPGLQRDRFDPLTAEEQNYLLRKQVDAAVSSSITISLPPEVVQYQHDIRRFVEAMVYKLVKHSGKGRWEGLGTEKGLDLLKDEVRELDEALQRGNMVETMLEAADVANFALIISAIVMERGK